MKKKSSKSFLREMSERLLEYLTGSAKLFSKINFVLKNDTDEAPAPPVIRAVFLNFPK